MDLSSNTEIVVDSPTTLDGACRAIILEVARTKLMLLTPRQARGTYYDPEGVETGGGMRPVLSSENI